MVELFANLGDPDQTPRFAVSDLGLHCLLNTLLGVSRLQWVKSYIFFFSSISRVHHNLFITQMLDPQ